MARTKLQENEVKEKQWNNRGTPQGKTINPYSGSTISSPASRIQTTMCNEAVFAKQMAPDDP